MKYLFAVVISAFVFLSCGDKKDSTPVEDSKDLYAYDSTDLNTTSIEDAKGFYQLSYKFKEGNKYRYRITTISEDEQTIRTDTSIDQNIKQSIIYVFNFEPSNIDDDGTAELNCSISSIKLEASSNEQSITYESGINKDSADVAKYSEYESMINNPFSIRIAGSGEILEIFRVDKILNKYIDIKGFRDSISAQEKTMIRNDLIDGVLKPLSVQVFRQMPEKSISRDSTWTHPQNPTRFMVYQISNTNIYRIASIEELEGDTLIKLEAELDTKISGDNKVTDRGITYEFDKPKTSADGTIYFNLTDGLIQKSKTGTTIEVSYTMEANTPQGKQKGSRKEIIRNINLVERF